MSTATPFHNLWASGTIAEAYQKFRPTYPNEVLERILRFLAHKNPGPWRLAIDVGCGSGQSTRMLSDHFETVIGCDVSKAQLAEGKKGENPRNVKYQLGSDSSIPAEDNSVDLVTSAMAAHWFDLKKFYSEVDRVLKPNGCLALYGYERDRLDKNRNGSKLSAVFDEYNFGILEEFRSERVMLVRNLYTDIALPYEEKERYDIVHDTKTTVADFVGYLSSWSYYHQYRTKYPDKADILQTLLADLMDILNVETTPENTNIQVSRTFFVLMARKPGY
ncbi:putative methyltransferase DDB_G0268948 [Glandiceps talaboti]